MTPFPIPIKSRISMIPRSVCDEGMGQMFHIRHGMGFVLETLVAVQK